jgi:tetratricopeptide (TPR) repeat protein
MFGQVQPGPVKFLILLTLFAGNSFAQFNTDTLNQWISDLSVKKDIRNTHLRYLYYKLEGFSPDTNCAIFNYLNTHRPTHNIRYSIRLNILKARMQIVDHLCKDTTNPEILLKEVLPKAYEINDDLLIFTIYLTLGSHYNHIGNFNATALNELLAFEIFEKGHRGDFFISSYTFYDLAYNFYHTGEYETALRAAYQALTSTVEDGLPANDTLGTNYQMFTWNVIGLAQQKRGKLDSALIAFDKALILAEKMKFEDWKGLLLGNKGDVYLEQGRLDTAAVLLKFDYETSKSVRLFDNAANSLISLARITFMKGDTPKALAMLREASQLLQPYPRDHYKENLWDNYVMVFTKMGLPDSAYFYKNQYQTLHDSLERIEYEGHTEILKMRMQNQTGMFRILSLNKEKHRIMLIRNFTIVIILLISALGYLYLNRQRLRLRLKQQQALAEKRKAEMEAATAREQLSTFTAHLVEKTQLVEELQARLINKELNQDQIERINELTHHTILTENDWEHFKELFERVYPGFFFGLKKQVPEISLAELRMASLIKLKLQVREAAILLGISPNSVHKTRQRLRLRLGLEHDSQLDVYFEE